MVYHLTSVYLDIRVIGAIQSHMNRQEAHGLVLWREEDTYQCIKYCDNNRLNSTNNNYNNNGDNDMKCAGHKISKKQTNSILLGRSYFSLSVQKQQNEEHFIMCVIYYFEWWEM